MPFAKELINHIGNNNIIIPQVPKQYSIGNLKNHPKPFTFRTPDAFFDHLNKEKAFWEEQKAKHAHYGIYCKAYEDAIESLHRANVEARDSHDNKSYIPICLSRATKNIEDVPYHETVLVRELTKYSDFGKKFFDGFLVGITNEDVSHKHIDDISKDYIRGLFVASSYLDLIKKIGDEFVDSKDIAQNAQATYVNVANQYVERYKELFEYKQKQFENLDNTIEKELEAQKIKFKRLKAKYEERLRFDGPAKYWSAMNKTYTEKGHKFLIASGIIALVSVAIIVTLALSIPHTNDGTHWFDYFKTTASVTIASAIAFYLLRVTVKMAMSSYHLSRDAMEREQLTHFYLSLVNESKVDPNERELILKSLFSRSNTGLIKGDDAPEIPLNFADFMRSK